jgi:aarF domain-containing kinase
MRTIDRVRRSTRVVWTASSIYLGYRRIAWSNRQRTPEEAARRLSEYHRQAAQRILATATELQGLLIKVGQLIGARADVFPDEYIEVLSKLHDTVPPRPFSVIRPVIERELGARIEDIFADLKPTPIASASLAQVHRGRLKDGRDVAVKVQYPDIEEIVHVDLQNVRILAQGAKQVLRDFDLTPIVEELQTNAPLELDFINEGQNAELAARNFAERDDIIVPKIYWEYTTRRVLTMEFLEGIKITDLAAIDAAGIDRQAISRLLAESYFKQIFAHGFFHADPHPGNLFVRPGPKLVIVDFGLAKQLPPTFLRGFVRLTGALIAGDKASLIQAFKDLGFKTKRADDSGFEALGEAMVTRLGRNSEFTRDRRMMIEFNDRMMKLFRENPIVRVPGEFLYIGRVMGLLGGLGTQLGSEVNLLEVLGAELPAEAVRSG